MRRIDPKSGAATLVSGRLTTPQLDWVNETWVQLGYKSRSEFLRAVVRIARKHQEDAYRLLGSRKHAAFKELGRGLGVA